MVVNVCHWHPPTSGSWWSHETCCYFFTLLLGFFFSCFFSICVTLLCLISDILLDLKSIQAYHQVAVNEVSSQPQLGDRAIDNSEEYREMMTSLGDRLSVHSKQVLYQRMMNIHFMHHLVHQFQWQDFSLVMKNLGIFSLITVSLESWLHHPLGIQLHLVTQQPEACPSVGEQILLEDHNFCKIHIQSLNPKP